MHFSILERTEFDLSKINWLRGIILLHSNNIGALRKVSIVLHSYQIFFQLSDIISQSWLWVAWPRDHEVRIIWYQSLDPLIRLYPFISCIFFTFRVNFSSCCLCFGFDLVSNQFRSYYLLPTLFLISCIELSLLGLKKSVILFFLSRISF